MASKAKENECSCYFHIRILYFAFSILCFLTISIFALTFCYVSQTRDTRFCLPEAPGQPFIRGTATISRSDGLNLEPADFRKRTFANTFKKAEKDGRSDEEREHNGIYRENKRRLNASREVEDDVSSRRVKRDVNIANDRMLQMLATVPISIPLSSIARVCNWTDGGCPRGQKGDLGPIGLTGQNGERGAPGPRGETGSRGKRGERGPKGHSGVHGEPGIRGDKGDIGLPGPQGPPGHPGTQIENCSCLGLRRSAGDSRGVAASVPLEELEAKMRRILLQSSISGVIIPNKTSDEAKVIISSFKSVRRNDPTPQTSASGEPTGVYSGITGDSSDTAQDSQLDVESDDGSVTHMPDLNANHAYAIPDSDVNSTARQPLSLDQSRTLQKTDGIRSRAGKDGVAEGTIGETASMNTALPTSFPSRALNTDSRTLTLTIHDASETIDMSGNDAEQSFLDTDVNGGVGDLDGNVIVSSSTGITHSQVQPMTTEAGNLPDRVTRLDMDDQKLMNISVLLQRLNELTANKTSLLNFVQMSISKTGSCGCPGPPGPIGPQGEVGPKGDMGMIGLQGFNGSKGEPGDKGERGSLLDGEGHILQGPPGPKGDQGLAGDRGPKGDPGIDGQIGFPGLQGEPGPHGMKGEAGDPGPMGSKGSKGDMGPIGSRGQMGYGGLKGVKGHPGIMGQKGVPGSTGPFGPKGIKGDQGKRGEQGYPGLTGSPGPPGEPGAPGRDGMRGQKGDRHTYVIPGSDILPTEYTSLTPPTANPTTKPANIDPSEKMFKIYEPIVNSKCRLTKISSPQEVYEMSRSFGAWMKDASTGTTDEEQSEMIWVTMHHRGAVLIEYENLEDMRDHRLSSTFALPFQWDGSGHVVYNGSFYYHHRDTAYIIRYNLTGGSIIKRVKVPSLGYQSDVLFQLSSGYTNVDFAVDENGLWIIYPLTRPGAVGKLAVSKLDPESLEIITTITTDHNYQSTANAFIVCGVLYTTKGPHSRPSRVDFAFDLLREVVLEDISMNIQNRHRRTVTLSYNPRDRLLYGWDKGKLLTYNLTIEEYMDE